MKVLILKPRLDLPFKKFGLEKSNKTLPAIRKPWSNFVDSLEKYHTANGDKVIVVEAPRWQFNKSLVEEYDPRIAYIPHVEKHNFQGGSQCMYYMQTVFPWLFTIDPLGWAGGASHANPEWKLCNSTLMYDNDIDYDDGKTFEYLKERALSGGSKFDQPKNSKFDLDEPFIFCPLQIPHDETIKWHSDVSMEHLVDRLCEWSSISGIKVVFKGHPVNPGSMEGIKSIIRHRAIYLTDVSIHEIIPKAQAVCIINSGTGIESMLHEVPIIKFGKADYNGAVVEGSLDNMEVLDKIINQAINQNHEEMVLVYKKFMNWFVNYICYDSRDSKNFDKLKDRNL